MRSINKDITYIQTIQTTKTAISEIMDKIEESKSEKYINVKVIYVDAENITLKEDVYKIIGTNYDLLMSANPDFAPLKPKDEYREVDLWHMIDLIRDGQ